MRDVLDDLRAELDDLDRVLSGLDDDGWSAPSACDGWTVADVVLHLAQTNEVALASAAGDIAAASSSEGFAGSGSDVDRLAAEVVAAERGGDNSALLDRWQRSADGMHAALVSAPSDARLRWVVGTLAPRTLASTRIAETWIHAGDVAFAFGESAPATDRLWHVARLVHRTLPYAFTRSSRDEPGSVAFDLAGPGGDRWTFGDPTDDLTVITGPAVDLCLVAGQRATAAATDLSGTGPDAADVLSLMRTFA